MSLFFCWILSIFSKLDGGALPLLSLGLGGTGGLLLTLLTPHLVKVLSGDAL